MGLRAGPGLSSCQGQPLKYRVLALQKWWDRTMLMRTLLTLTMMVAGNATLAFDCGGRDQPCTVSNGSYHLALPDNWQGGPAVMHLHGYGGSGGKVIGNKGFIKRLTDRGYAVIAPTALPWAEGKPNDWSVRDGWLVYPRRDIPFLREVLDDAASRAGIDPGRVLLSGFSRGGSMVWDIACHAPDLAAAYAPAAGGFWAPMPTACSGPAKILHTHGFADTTVPLEGRSLRNEALQITIRQADIWQGLQLWRRENNCPSNAQDIGISDGKWRKSWTCEAGALTLILHKGKHGFPKGWTTDVLDWFEALQH